jgi:hypothetical protein
MSYWYSKPEENIKSEILSVLFVTVSFLILGYAIS